MTTETFETAAVLADALAQRVGDAIAARPELVIAIELQGYGLQPVVVPPTVQTQVMRVGAELTQEQPDHLTSRLILRLPRVFLTA